MIIFGCRSYEVGTKPMMGVICPACKLTRFALVGMQQMFHIFWIPIIPLEKSTHIICDSCKATYSSAPYLSRYNSKETSFKTPWWSLFGLGIILLIGVLSSFENKMDDKRKNAFQADPHTGRYFTFKSREAAYESTPYVFGRIDRVTDDKVFVRRDRYGYSQERAAVRSAETAKYKTYDVLGEQFSPEVVELSKEDFQKMNIQTVLD